MALKAVDSLAIDSALTEPSAAVKVKGILNSVDGGLVVPVPGPATAMPASGSKLVKNTYYQEALTNGETFLLPTRAESTAGDWIIFRQPSDISNNHKIVIGSAANGDFAVGCHLTGVNTLDTQTQTAVDISVAGDNSINIEGETNGFGSKGSWVGFLFNGTEWTATGVGYNIGDGSVLVLRATGLAFAATA